MRVKDELQYELYQKWLSYLIVSSDSISELYSKIKEMVSEVEISLNYENMLATLTVKLYDYIYYINGRHVEFLWQKQELEKLLNKYIESEIENGKEKTYERKSI